MRSTPRSPRTPRALLALAATAALVLAPSAAFAGERPSDAGRQDAATGRTAGSDDLTHDVADDGDNAHPSGRDRSVEPGRSGAQGAAQSDPDDDGRGPDRSNDGVDRAGGHGGVDRADQDGNNGCGNDDDFEDDNEGRCGGPDDRERGTDAQPTATTRAGEDAAPQATRDDTDGAGQQAAPVATADATPTSATPTSTTTTATSATTTATFACTSVSVTSTKDLSNVVLVFADGDVQRFEGLSGHAGTFAGTDDHAGERIARVYVKSGANASGEGPGYGTRHDSDAACVAATTADAVTAHATITAPLAGSAPVTAAAVPFVVAAAGTAGPAVSPAVWPAAGDGVLGARFDRPVVAAPAGEAGVAAAGMSVRPAAVPSLLGTELPRTGTGAGAYALAAILTLGGGVLAVRRSRTA